MQFYFAPMEGITGYVVRNAFFHHFNLIGKYFTPFIPSAKKMNYKIARDLAPENNHHMNVVPQLISNNAEDVLLMEEQLIDLGYTSVNLNLGCPSGTVVNKGRGSGALADVEHLDAMLYEIFDKTKMPLSIKTRIGIRDESEWDAILSVYEKYSMEELIIHPRLQKDFYKGHCRMEAFAKAQKHISKTSLCYNGDICTVADYQRFTEAFPGIDKVMIGRGLLMHPDLIEQITGVNQGELRPRLISWYDEIYENYNANFSGEKDTMMHMKEMWFYLGQSFLDCEKDLKKLKKANQPAEFKAIASHILREAPFNESYKAC